MLRFACSHKHSHSTMCARRVEAKNNKYSLRTKTHLVGNRVINNVTKLIKFYYLPVKLEGTKCNALTRSLDRPSLLSATIDVLWPSSCPYTSLRTLSMRSSYEPTVASNLPLVVRPGTTSSTCYDTIRVSKAAESGVVYLVQRQRTRFGNGMLFVGRRAGRLARLQPLVLGLQARVLLL